MCTGTCCKCSPQFNSNLSSHHNRLEFSDHHAMHNVPEFHGGSKLHATPCMVKLTAIAQMAKVSMEIDSSYTLKLQKPIVSVGC